MTTTLLTYLQSEAEPESQAVAGELESISGLQVYPRSITAAQGRLLFLGRRGVEKFLGILAIGSTGTGFTGQAQPVMIDDAELTLTICPTTSDNAAALRSLLPFLVAQPLGLRKSAGCGDRLGLATPGHIRAIRHSTMAPILAQQSMRENARTGRTPQEVMDDATWGVFQEGWREGFGADADHLKTTHDIDICVAAGYTFFTIDPGEYVDNSANYVPVSELAEKIENLPWRVLDSDRADTERRLADQPLDLGQFNLTISGEELARAMAKYGRAVAHTVSMYRHLAEAKDGRPFELEMSVDETETVTTLAEHVYIANELKRLGVKWVSLAPRYVGEFEKGVDYKGDLAEFEKSFARHLAVAQTYGPYKLSLHSGSDKFSIYPVASRVAGDLVHLKTAGTSYLEALRAIAQLNPTLFRQMVDFAPGTLPHRPGYLPRFRRGEQSAQCG
ncbi:MAG: tagaturonate epimerase family protein [Anaerolineae bacterium]